MAYAAVQALVIPGSADCCPSSHRAATGGLVTPGYILWEGLAHAEGGLRVSARQWHVREAPAACRPLCPCSLPGLSLHSASPFPPTQWDGVKGQDWPSQVDLSLSPSFSIPAWEFNYFWSKAEENLAGRAEDFAEAVRQTWHGLPSVYQPPRLWAHSGELVFSALRKVVWFGDSFYFTTKMSDFFPLSLSLNKGEPFGFHNSDHLTSSWNLHLGSRAQSLLPPLGHVWLWGHANLAVNSAKTSGVVTFMGS